MDPTKWQCLSNVFGGARHYIAARPKNPNEPLHGGNVEYHGKYTQNLAEAEATVERLNAEIN